MKNILIPTDFSTPANNALRYAINIANHFESKIHLIHVFSVPSETGMLDSVKRFLQNEAEIKLTKLVRESKNKLFQKTSLEAKAIEGYPELIITEYAKKINADIIIMGTQGASGLREVFIGSNATAVIKKSKIPVLAIPVGYTYKPFRDIVLAIDDEAVNGENVFTSLIKLAKAYKAHVSILHVEKKKVPVGVDDSVGVNLAAVPHSFNTIYNDRIKIGIDNFVKKIDASLLCMIHRRRGFIENLFHRSVVKKEAFNSPVPLLVLYDED